MLDFNPVQRPANIDPASSFAEAIQNAGLPTPGDIIGDGKLRRFDIKRRGDGAGWYVFFLDGDIPAGAFGNWQSGEKFTWSTKSRSEMSDHEREEFNRHVEQIKEARAAEQQRLNERAREHAVKVWTGTEPATADHPYLKAKGVGAYGLKTDGESLVVPFFDIFGDVHSLQWIKPDGSKKFEYGGAITGNFFIIRGDESEVFIAEGYATAATIHEATGATVVVAFNTSNLSPVAENIRSKYGRARITIAADNDQFTTEPIANPGVYYAKKAAEAIGARFVVPEFGDISTKPTDFNDLAKLEGLDAVKKQIKGQGLDIRDWTLDAYQGDAPERVYLVESTIPLASVTILAAMGDAGKGLLTLDLALSVAAEKAKFELLNQATAFGHLVNTTGTAVIFTAEDDKAEVHRRIEQIAGAYGFDRRESIERRLMVVPLPNAGGPFSLVSPGKYGPEATDAFRAVRQQLLKIDDLRLVVFDPLASFCAADINADPAVGAFTTGLLSNLSTETGASIIVAHHTNKTSSEKPIRTAEMARNLIRGTSAIVDGVRAAYVLWPAEPHKARRACKTINADYAPNKVFFGALVKANGPGDRTVKTYVRQDSGLLINMTDAIGAIEPTREEIYQILRDDIAAAAADGRPFTKTGAAGLFERRDELFEGIRFSKHRLPELADEMVEAGIIVRAIASGSKVPQWLDIPGGPFDNGTGCFELGGRRNRRE